MKINFFKKFSITALGSSIALIIPLFTSPIISRIYGPEEFASLSLFISSVGLISIVSSGQIQNALFDPQIRNKYTIPELFGNYISYSILWIIVLTFLYFISTYFFKLNVINGLSISHWFLIIIGVCLLNFNSFLNHLIILDEKFVLNSRNKILSSFTVSTFQIGLFKVVNKLGLIFGYLAGLIISNFNFLSGVNVPLTNNKLYNPIKTGIQFKRYTLTYTLSTLVGQLNTYAPIYFLPIFYNMTVLGQYAFGMKLFQIPLNIFSKSIQEVFKQESSAEILEFGNCRKSFKKSLYALVSISAIPFTILYFTVEAIIPLIFGNQWQEAGTILKILSPSLFLKFITSPLSFVFILKKKQNLDLIIQSLIGICILIIFLVGNSMEFVKIIKSINVIYCLLYLTYLIMSYRYSR